MGPRRCQQLFKNTLSAVPFAMDIVAKDFFVCMNEEMEDKWDRIRPDVLCCLAG